MHRLTALLSGIACGVALAAPPGAPTSVVAVPGNARATVYLKAPASDGGFPITSYTVTAAPGGATVAAASWPIAFTGLANGTSYTFTVRAANASGTGPPSAPSAPVRPVPPTASPAVASQESFALALDVSGQVYAWGSDSHGQLGQSRRVLEVSPVRVAGLPAITQISYGDQALAIDGTGQVWSWGGNCGGALGARASGGAGPARVTGATGAVRVAAGFCTSYLLKSDGTVWKFGSPVYATGNPPTQVTQVPGLSGIVEISAGRHLLALKSDGTVWATGANDYGQLGVGSTAPVSGVVQVPGLAGVTRIAAGLDMSVALLSNGQVRFWGQYNFGAGQSTSPAAVSGLGGIAVAIAAGGSSFAAVRADGTVWAWSTSLSAPQQVASLNGTATLAFDGYQNYYAIDGAGGLRARGYNHAGQLGQGYTSLFSEALGVPGFQAGTLQVRSGSALSALALKTDGSVWFWGSNTAGQNGDGAGIDATTPLAVPIPATIRRIAAGYKFGAALDVDGKVWGWGDNGEGALGADFSSRSSPAPIAGLTGVTEIAAGAASLAYLKSDGSAWWKANPMPLTGIVAVGMSAGSAYFVRNDGALFAVGGNSNGELGDGTTTDRTSPVQVQGVAGVVTKVVGSVSRVAALTADGRVYTWGGDISGADLTGGTRRPVLVPGITDAVDVAVSANGGLVRRANGSLSGWGLTYIQGAPATDLVQPYPIAFGDTVRAFALAGRQGFLVGSQGLAWGWGFSDVSLVAGTVGDGAYVYRSRPVVLLAHGGNGTLDGQDWFLDLEPASPETIPPAAIPRALATSRSSGGLAGLALDGTVRYRSADFGKAVSNFVLGLVPPAFFEQVPAAPGRSDPAAMKARAAKSGGFVLAQLTPEGWVDVTGRLIAYSTSVANAAGSGGRILGGIDASILPGARFCIGYGDSAQSMLSAASLREILLLEGASAAVSDVPCVLSGIYLDGPPTSTAATPVAFNASVVGLSPSGTVTFSDGFASLGTIALAAANEAVGKATVSTASLAVGPHSISAAYSGGGPNPASTTASPLVHTVVAPMSGTQTTLAGPASALSGTETTFIAVVTGRTPSGAVQFKDGAADLGSPVPLVGGVAALRVSTLALGAHGITAAYSGDPDNLASTSAVLPHLVAEALSTRVDLAVSPAAVKLGTPVTLSAIVNGNSPTGTVQFHDNGQPLAGAVALATGQAALTTAGLAAGTHVITASYSGDADDPAATSPARVVDVALEIDPAQAAADTDLDGVPNGVEAAERLNPLIRDNDIFGNPRLFAMQQYRDFLGREGDPGGIAFWSAQLASGAQTRPQMAESYFNSAEFQGTGAPVARLYFAYFLRIPDYGGLLYWIGRFRAGDSLIAISNLFATSPEFANTYGSLDNAGFVDRVYRNVLGRPPDGGGLSYWTGRMNSGMTRGEMMVAFSESPEYRFLIGNEVYVTMMYVGMLRRAPDAGGFSYWVGYMDAGNSGLALTGAFVAAPEYRGRFLP